MQINSAKELNVYQKGTKPNAGTWKQKVGSGYVRFTGWLLAVEPLG